MSAGRPIVSVVVPVFRNPGGLAELLERVETTMRDHGWTHEVLLIDDASGDGSWRCIEGLASQHPEVTGARLARNVGSAEARATGCRLARGEVVCTIDADLENRPEDLAALVALVVDGTDLVSAVRSAADARPGAARAQSRLARLVCAPAWEVPPRDLGCGMKAWSASAGRRAEELRSRHGELRFLLALHDVARSYREVPTTWVDRHQVSTHSPATRLRLGIQLLAALRPGATAAIACTAAAAAITMPLRLRRAPTTPARSAVVLGVSLALLAVSAAAGCGAVLARRTVVGTIAELTPGP